MQHREPKPAVYLAAVLATEVPNGGGSPCGMPAYPAARDAETLVRLGKRALRIAEQKCNGIERYDAKARQVLASWTEADEARAEKTIAKIEADAAAILQPYGATDIKAQGDPRGFVLTFRLASGRSNSFGDGVWGV
ncbi:hypothetical protein [Mesorhizobium sp.]|uniref:hypothetical protein n=1 Tax=Mesorhizobium sp. TaxID=1871066 RepID=UPI00120B3F85|nr:hypothetical protein [Mesorhizobium sp.]TIX28863.1 MAG: hypothetical protein E5V35_00445 [Mesorhizobium sp.]